MESTLSQLRSLFESYGGLMTLMIILTILIVNIIKKPLLKKAIELAEMNGYDKSIVTRYVSFLPIVVMFMLLFIYDIITLGFNYIDWTSLLTRSTSYGAIAIATYEVIKKQLQAYASKNQYAVEHQFDEEKEDLRQTVIALEEMQKQKEDELTNLRKMIKESYGKEEVVALRKAYEDTAKENNSLKAIIRQIGTQAPKGEQGPVGDEGPKSGFFADMFKEGDL